MNTSAYPAEETKLLLIAAALGLAAIIALPLSASTAPQVAAGLVFATPLLLITLGRMRGQTWLLRLGVGVTVVLVGVVVTGVLGVGFAGTQLFAVAVLFAGPVVAAVGVGVALRNRDTGAYAAFLLSATIAVVFGFIGANTPGAGVLVVAIVVAGWLLTRMRLMAQVR